MNFSVHFDETTVERLSKAVDQVGLTRNRIIVRAVQEWLERNEEKDWPELLKSHFRNPAPELAANDALDAKTWRPNEVAAGAKW
ncbi:MAG: CopG family transcriptional regulator [Stenotrophobium sp.]